MVRLAIAALAILLGSSADALAVHKRQGSCTQPLQRRAWHTLSDDEKKAYIKAEQCLMTLPATLGLRGTQTRFDELQSCHVLQAEITHNVGAFLPFHRLLMWAHEHLLRTECGYEGAQPYWQEQLDAGNFINSVVLDPETGFGGDGTGENNCIEDGPFAGYLNHLGPGYELNDHCIDRNVNDRASLGSTQENVDTCLAAEDWLTAWHCIEGQPHGGGHGGIGGEMQNPVSSPGDPVFYLHHTWLDKVWWDWQSRDLPNRLTEMGGNNRRSFANDGAPSGAGSGFNGTTGGRPGFPGGDFNGTVGTGNGGAFATRPDDVPEPEVVGDPGDETTLEHVINMYGVIDAMTIGEVMDIGDILCYEYIEP